MTSTIKWNNHWRTNADHEITPFIVLIRIKKRVHKRRSLSMVNRNGYRFFKISDWYVVVIEDPQLLLFWNGFWYTRDVQANIETMLTGALKLILAIYFH